MYMANSHLKIMQSFVSNPQLHISARESPEMASGPFIQYGASEVNKVKALLDKTKQERSQLLSLANAVQTLNKLLGAEAGGGSLEPFYRKMPEALDGYVELVYDLANNPSIRLLEGLLYKSRYYTKSLQSVALSLVNTDHRPFVFNTPRFETEREMHLDIPFADERLDRLFMMRDVPQPYGRIRDILEIGENDDELFSTLFTEQRTTLPQGFGGEEGQIRIRYFGHACILIESKGVSILCDPLIGYKYGDEMFRYGYEDLPEVIDYVLITHSHQDHLVLEMLLQLRHKIRNIIVPRSGGAGLADPSIKLLLTAIGFRNVIEIDGLETLEIEGGEIISVPFLGEHGDLHVSAKTAYWIELFHKRILCLADSNNIAPKLYAHIHELLGNADVIFIGMECDGAPMSWVYGPFMTAPLSRVMDQSRRLDGSDHRGVMDIVDRFHPKEVYVYAMGQEPWVTCVTGIQYTEKSRPITESQMVIDGCRERGIASERLFGCKELLI